MEKLCFLLIITFQAATSILLSDQEDNYDYSWNNCAFNGRLCDPQTGFPCCSQRDKCLPTVFGGYFEHMCRNEVHVGDPCKNGVDCLELGFAICKKNRCQCIENYVVSNSSKCASVLGERCIKNDNCAPENSVCDKNHQCSCRPFYRPVSKNQCKLSLLGKNCNSDFDCEDIKRMKCSKVKKQCVCRPFHDVRNNSTCIPTLHGSCDSSDSCATNNSKCVHNKCQCELGFKATEANECVKEF